MPVHWSWRSSASAGALPADASSALCRRMAKPTPGIPSRHLLADAARPSKGTARASSGIAPKALIASISSRRRWRAVTSASAAIGLRMPEVVSQCTAATWLIAGSAASARSSGLRVVRLVLGRLEHRHLAAVIARHLDHALAIGAVDQDQQLAVPRHQRAEHGLDHEGAAALERDGDVAAGAAGQLDQARAHPRIERDELAIARAPVAQHRLLDRGRRGQAGRGSADRARRACLARWGALRVGSRLTFCGSQAIKSNA